MSPIEVEPQTLTAQRMYDPRAETYDDSWHPSYTERFCALLPLRPGDAVLDLACGTGLDALMAADAVGSSGSVVGVDISSSMLAQAESKLSLAPCPTQLYLHDIADLDTISNLVPPPREKFDAIICSNAIVLLDDPLSVIRGWIRYLKSGGFLALDVTHERESAAVRIMQRVVDRMGVDYTVPRHWLKDKSSMREILQEAGLEVEAEYDLDRIPGQKTVALPATNADSQFEWITMRTSPSSTDEASSTFLSQARDLFREEWEKEATNGSIEIVESMYIYVARKK